MKVIRDEKPARLHDILKSTYYSERQNVARGLFYDASRTKCGRQSIQNRLKHVAQIKKPWNELGAKITNDGLRVLLKETFFSCNFQLTNNVSPVVQTQPNPTQIDVAT